MGAELSKKKRTKRFLKRWVKADSEKERSEKNELRLTWSKRKKWWMLERKKNKNTITPRYNGAGNRNQPERDTKSWSFMSFISVTARFNNV